MSASGVSWKNMYQLSLSWSKLMNAPAITGPGGTAAVTTRRQFAGLERRRGVGAHRSPVVADEHGVAVAAQRGVQRVGVHAEHACLEATVRGDRGGRVPSVERSDDPIAGVGRVRASGVATSMRCPDSREGTAQAVRSPWSAGRSRCHPLAPCSGQGRSRPRRRMLPAEVGRTSSDPRPVRGAWRGSGDAPGVARARRSETSVTVSGRAVTVFTYCSQCARGDAAQGDPMPDRHVRSTAERHVLRRARLDAVLFGLEPSLRGQHLVRDDRVGPGATRSCSTWERGCGSSVLTQPHDGTFRGTALVSHLHWDHVQGIPFFAPMLAEGAHLESSPPRRSPARCARR